MKDLYTFDSSKESALQTYETVRKAYTAFFKEFKVPFLTAEASSGDIGGELSHEYHLPSSKGEDSIIKCTSCNYVANEELAGIDQPRLRVASSGLSSLAAAKHSGIRANSPDSMLDYSNEWEGKYSIWRGISKDQLVLYEAIFPSEVESVEGAEQSLRRTEINPHTLKKYADDIDLSVADVRTEDLTDWRSSLQKRQEIPPSQTSQTIIRLYDYRLPQTFIDDYEAKNDLAVSGTGFNSSSKKIQSPPVDLIKIHTGDKCSKCNTGTLKIQNAIELGHTFHLGTRYSAPLQASFTPNPTLEPPHVLNSTESRPTKPPSTSLLQMGCHGIGISRMIAAIAESLCDSKGLNWPRVMAPFEAVIIPTKGLTEDAAAVYDLLVQNQDNEAYSPGVDAILDDRNKDFSWKVTDADLIGYPVIVILGRKWRSERTCEVQCRQLDGWRENVAEGDLKKVVQGLLGRL